jgi:hypothetical protein
MGLGAASSASAGKKKRYIPKNPHSPVMIKTEQIFMCLPSLFLEASIMTMFQAPLSIKPLVTTFLDVYVTIVKHSLSTEDIIKNWARAKNMPFTA